MSYGSDSSLILYQTEDGSTKVEVHLLDETVWLNQAQMGELFDKDKRTISEHIKNIFNEGELKEDSVVRNFRITATDGKSYQVLHYNLDVIISVGYRVASLISHKCLPILSGWMVLGYMAGPPALITRWS